MKRMAMVQNGVVANCALWDGVSAWAPEGFALVDITGTAVDIGWSWDGVAFHAPADPIADAMLEGGV